MQPRPIAGTAVAVAATALVMVTVTGCHHRLPAPTADASATGVAAHAADTAWTVLFDGRDLSGWQHVGDGAFVVENGAMRTRGGMGLLWYTVRPFRDVVLRVVYRNPGGDNSGVFVRIPEPPTSAWQAVHGGYEVQIDDSADEYHRTGVLYDLTAARSRPGPSGPGGWNTMDIVLVGPRTIVTVNDALVTDYTEGQPQRPRPWYQFWKFWAPQRGRRPVEGYVGLQNHARRDTVFFRSIRVRPLSE